MIGCDQGIVGGFDPILEIRVGNVTRNGVVLQLGLVGVKASVEDDGDVVGEDCGGAGPAAFDIKGL